MRCPVSGVRPASVDKIVTIFMDRSSPNLEHSFPVSYRSKVFFCSSIGSSVRACATIVRYCRLPGSSGWILWDSGEWSVRPDVKFDISRHWRNRSTSTESHKVDDHPITAER